jgi:thioredoxin reductase (NADPH)
MWRAGAQTAPRRDDYVGSVAVGDLRHRSVKRVASAVGDGAIAVQPLHELAQEQGADERRGSARA